jgi:8-oxo-dGTP pyrophosphatase MutT (NUDIX family)
MWKTKKSEVVFTNQWITLHNDQIEFDNGSPGVYSYIDRPHGAEAVIITPSQKIVLLNQFRYPQKTYDWSTPGGKIDAGETPESAVKRECLEEVGVNLTKVEKLGVWSAQSSANTEEIHMFVAWSKDEPHKAGLSDESVKEIKLVTATEALTMIDEGVIKDPVTIAAFESTIRRYL